MMTRAEQALRTLEICQAAGVTVHFGPERPGTRWWARATHHGDPELCVVALGVDALDALGQIATVLSCYGA
jgi:hypothetical protein